ncbi:unnamed protein product [Ambrosiozyma monospora]|uniref:Unnamed protein product n=1 Tax=Ambrosiozyma monospora TaxID=43982 RepID=A0ACB5TC84_AMBMO|nr:unnamed protein product [Ambrosiozyma monospora]
MNGASSTSISSSNGLIPNGHSRHYRANGGSSISTGSINKRCEFDDIAVVEKDEDMNDNDSTCSSDTGSVIHHRFQDDNDNDNVNGSGSSINLSNGKSISITLNGSGIDPVKHFSMPNNLNHENGVHHGPRSRSRSDVGFGSGSSASSFVNLHSNNAINNGNSGVGNGYHVHSRSHSQHNSITLSPVSHSRTRSSYSTSDSRSRSRSRSTVRGPGSSSVYRGSSVGRENKEKDKSEYLEVGESDEFITDVRNILRKRS